jgi:hypothetical protein
MVDSSRLGSVAIVAAALVFSATACSSPPTAAGKPEVATLRSADAVASAAPSSAAAQAPRQRLDDTAADIEALFKPYTDCMKSHGLGAKGQLLGSDRTPSKAVSATAEKDCQPRYPLPPWELDPANPEAKDFARDVVKCLKDKGVQYVEVNPDGPGWAFGGPQNDARSISKGMDLSPACEREVAARKK